MQRKVVVLKVDGNRRGCYCGPFQANKNPQQIHDISALIAWCGTDVLEAVVTIPTAAQ